MRLSMTYVRQRQKTTERNYKMYIVFYAIQGEEYSIRFNSKQAAQLFARKYNGKVSI